MMNPTGKCNPISFKVIFLIIIVNTIIVKG